MLIQASFLLCQISHCRAHAFIAQSELEMPLVVRGHLDLKLHPLPGSEAGDRSIDKVQKSIPTTRWHGQVHRAEALRAVVIVTIAKSSTPHGRVVDESMPLRQCGQEQRDGT